jgi:superfamily II DNA or RNA helicase
MPLRDYQLDVVEGQLYKFLSEGETHVLLVAPTGAGKTILTAHIMRDAIEAGCNILFVVHLDGLAEQAAERFISYGINKALIGYQTGGRPEHRDRPLQICSIQALGRRSWWRDTDRFGMVIHDEAHLTSFFKTADYWFSPEYKGVLIGLTATPTRLSKKESMLSRGYRVMAQSPPVAALMEHGSLCHLRYYAFPKGGQIDLSGVKTRNGDFDQSELSQRCDRPELLQHCVQQWKRFCEAERRPTLAFCVTIKHAEDLAAAFNAAGIPAASVCANTPRDERTKLYDALDTGEVVVLAAVNVTAIGFDKPCTSCAILARPTKSESVHIQQIGRVARVMEGKKDAIVIDQSGNVLRHGTLCLQGPWSLTDAESKAAGEIPMKACEKCGALVHLSVMECECGYQFPRKAKPQPRTDDLVEFKPQTRINKETRRLRTLIRQANERGHLPRYVDLKFKEEFGWEPTAEMYRASLYPTPRLEYLVHYATALGVLAREKDRRLPMAVIALSREFGGDFVTKHMDQARAAFEEARSNDRIPYQPASEIEQEFASA